MMPAGVCSVVSAFITCPFSASLQDGDASVDVKTRVFCGASYCHHGLPLWGNDFVVETGSNLSIETSDLRDTGSG